MILICFGNRSEAGYTEVMELLEHLRPNAPSVETIQIELKKLFESHIASYKEELEASGREWNAEARRKDPWRGIYPYKKAEYRDGDGKLAANANAKTKGIKVSIWVWSEISAGAPASKQSPTTKDSNHFNYRYYKPLHPVTGKPCPHPRGGWKFSLSSGSRERWPSKLR